MGSAFSKPFRGIVGASAGEFDVLGPAICGPPQHLFEVELIVIDPSPKGPGLLSEISGRIAPRPVITSTHDPFAHRVRPTIDPPFGSGAALYGQRVIGIVMSGRLTTASTRASVNQTGADLAGGPDLAGAMIATTGPSAEKRLQVDFSLPVRSPGPRARGNRASAGR